jgi:hypothetical protein
MGGASGSVVGAALGEAQAVRIRQHSTAAICLFIIWMSSLGIFYIIIAEVFGFVTIS